MTLYSIIKRSVRLTISLIRSLYINFKCLPIKQAIHLPILIDYKMKVEGQFKRGSIVINKPISFRMIRLGFENGSFDMGGGDMLLRMKSNAHLVFNGTCSFAKGCHIIVNEGAIMEFGNNCSFNVNTLVNAGSSIVFGDDFLGGWNVTIIDGDGHQIIDCNNTVINDYKPIVIGAHCWMSAHSSLLKGVNLPDECIIPYGSIITKSCLEQRVIYGGVPNRVLKAGIKRK